MKFLSLILILPILIINRYAIHRPYQTKKDEIKQLILARVNKLPEVKEWFITAKKSKPQLIVNEPNSKSKYYSVQVGINNNDMFRTNYYLYIDPKTLAIYYWDELDTVNSLITLQ